MKKFDLESKIRSIRVPEREPEFWEKMPGRVLEHAHSGDSAGRRHLPFPSPFIVAMARISVACVVAGVCLWQSGLPQTMSRNLIKDEKALRQSLNQVPKHLEAMMRDEHGLHYLIQDSP
jgi:hypothetical protein